MIQLLKIALQWLLRLVYRVEVKGMEHYHAAGERVLIVANHVSFLDGFLLAVFLPDRVSFAIDPRMARRFKPYLALVNIFPMASDNPLATKSLIRYLQQGKKVVIFPEGRITVTGGLMKVYPGPAMVAERSGATLLPLRIDGPQYSRFSRLHGLFRLRRFPKVTLTICPPRSIAAPEHLSASEKREHSANALYRVMTEMMFATSNYDHTVFEAVILAAQTHGWKQRIVEDTKRQPLSYRALIMRSFILGKQLSGLTRAGEYVGLLMPNAVANVVCFLGLHVYGRVPAMLNVSAGSAGLRVACETAAIKNVITSRQFVAAAGLAETVAELAKHVTIYYLEDIAADIGGIDKLRGVWQSRWPLRHMRRHCAGVAAGDAAVVLFTSGSEGTPKGVVLSHRNIVGNAAQIASSVDFGPSDVLLNALPMFHSFGLTAGTLLPLLSGMKAFLYPSPLHYKIIPDVIYNSNATVLFGTNTFLKGYAHYAHPYDFYRLRYVIAGAEKLRDDVRQIWLRRFGVRILEGYGVTEASPVLSVNTNIVYREGSVGCFLPGIEYELEKVEGINEGGRLHVKGPNIMLGYLLYNNPGVLVPPKTIFGESWHDTGDIVNIDDEGFVYILGRAKRFAKIGGEMVSLAAVEEIVHQLWSADMHAVVALVDEKKGEKLVLLTTCKGAERHAIVNYVHEHGISELHIPRDVLISADMPLLSTGKIDFGAVKRYVESLPGCDESKLPQDQAQY